MTSSHPHPAPLATPVNCKLRPLVALSREPLALSHRAAPLCLAAPTISGTVKRSMPGFSARSRRQNVTEPAGVACREWRSRNVGPDLQRLRNNHPQRWIAVTCIRDCSRMFGLLLLVCWTLGHSSAAQAEFVVGRASRLGGRASQVGGGALRGLGKFQDFGGANRHLGGANPNVEVASRGGGAAGRHHRRHMDQISSRSRAGLC